MYIDVGKPGQRGSGSLQMNINGTWSNRAAWSGVGPGLKAPAQAMMFEVFAGGAEPLNLRDQHIWFDDVYVFSWGTDNAGTDRTDPRKGRTP